MPEIGSASLAVIPSFKGFQNELENGTSKHMAAAGATGGAQFGDSAGKSAGSKFRAHVKSFAKIAAVGLGLATAAAFKFAGDAVEEAREAQKVGALTESTIKATGKAARVTAKHVGDLSGRISEKVGLDDEAIQSGANMLLTFKNIRNEAGEGNKIFDQTLTTLVDMSSAMGTDAKTSAIQLGKALNDPIKGVSALSRVGVTFTDQQKNQIKALVEAGNVMGAQKIVLRELKSEFGGAAKAQATEADKLSVAWGNFKEEIGTQLLPVMDDLAIFLRKKGIPAAKDFAGWVRDDMIPAAKDAYEELKPLIGGVKDLAKFINDLPKPAKIAGIAAVLGGIGYAKLRGGALGGKGGGVLGGIGKAVGLAKPVPVFVTNPGFGDGTGLPGKKPGKVPLLATGLTAAAIGAGSHAAIKANKERDISAALGGAPAAAGGGFTLPKDALDFSDGMDKTTDSIIRANDAASKLPNQFEVGKTAGQNLADVVLGVKRGIEAVPTTHATRFDAPNLLSILGQTREYKGMLEGLDGRTVNTFIKTTRLRNDIGESGDPRFGGFRAHGGAMHPGYGYWAGENGPEYIEPTQRARVTPASEMGSGGGMPRTVILSVDGAEFRAYVDDRITANRHHPTGRRR